MSVGSKQIRALSIVAIVLAAAAIGTTIAIPGPAGPAGAQGPPGPTGVGLSPKTQKLRIELGEGEIIQEVQGKDELTGEYHRWEPIVLVVKKGDRVELTVVNPRRNAHSLVISAYNVDTGRIPGRVEQADLAKRTVTVSFVADKVGVFKFECGMPFDEAKKDCDPDHRRMVGHLIVLDV